MTAKSKWPGILSLSAASLALLQSTSSADGHQNDLLIPAGLGALHDGTLEQGNNLLLTPANQEQLLRMYAGHSSHASHASHSSHYSGTGGSDYAPSPPPVRTPVYVQPTPVQPSRVEPTPQIRPAPPLSATNIVPRTNSVPSAKIAPTNNVVSADWNLDKMEKDAAAESSDAQLSLAYCYIYGSHGVRKNLEKAKLLLEMSALQGNNAAKFRLEQLKQDSVELEKQTNK